LTELIPLTHNISPISHPPRDECIRVFYHSVVAGCLKVQTIITVTSREVKTFVRADTIPLGFLEPDLVGVFEDL
jgi:hypothetical protein